MKDDEIEYGTFRKDHLEDYYLNAKPKVFTNEDIQNTIFTDQTTNIINGNTLESFLNKPFKVKNRSDSIELNNFIKNNVLYGDQYQFWEKDDGRSSITYYQQYDGKTLL